MSRLTSLILCAVAFLSSCRTPPPTEETLTVAAAANLTDVIGEIGRTFEAKTGIKVIFSYGSTAQLATQIDNGAPFDLFAAADTEHIDALVAAHKLTNDSRAVYALGQLALWIPDGEQLGVSELKDLAGKQIRFVAIAQPELAPYGQAAVDVLKGAGLWDSVQPKLVYGTSISMAKQYAASGSANADLRAFRYPQGELTESVDGAAVAGEFTGGDQRIDVFGIGCREEVEGRAVLDLGG